MNLVVRGGLVVDGTGAAGRIADVAVRDGIITEVGPDLASDGATTVDADGLVVAPGFIDIHTHYDAQVLWDRDLTPSCWHGVTTVIMGNCGFGVAPTRPEHREAIIRTLENVEGMSADALQAGIPWTFETFPEYLDAIESEPTRLNVGAMIGHSPLRLYVLGDDVEAPATDAQLTELRTHVAEALAAGAVGFATSVSPNHQGAWGRPVPSRFAEISEIFSLASTMHDIDRGVLQVTPGPGLATAQIAELAQAIGRPVTWTALQAGAGGRGKTKEILDRTEAFGGEVWPQTACAPVVMQVTMADPFPFAPLPAFQEILAVPLADRRAIYADPAWRERARPEFDSLWGPRLSRVSVQETERHLDVVGTPMDELATMRSVHPLDLLVDLSLDEDLRTRFRVVIANDNEEELTDLLRDPRAVLGLSDAGAHASQLCDASFSSHLLGYWVREKQAFPLEFAIWRLTGHAAHVFRLPDRGRIAPGFAADLVAFDPATIGVEPMERVFDSPGGADRLIARSRGVEHIWVNGVPIREHGTDLTARPGALIRGGVA